MTGKGPPNRRVDGRISWVSMHNVSRWLAYALLSFACWGVWGALTKFASVSMTPAQIQSLFTIGMLPLAGLAVWQLGGRVETDRRGASYGVLNGVFAGAGMLAYNAAIATGPASIVAPATALFPLITVVLAMAVLGERINRVQAVGITLALCAFFLLAE